MATIAGVTNRDDSFFTVETDEGVEGEVLEQDIVSLSITEEMDAIDSGSLQLLDPDQAYSRMLRIGRILYITWGYGRPDQRSKDRLERFYGISEANQNTIRRGLKVMVQSPSGGADENGKVTYNCSFIALEQRGEQRYAEYTSGTFGGVINRVFDRMGVGKRVVQFELQNERLNEQTDGGAIYQRETDFNFLTRLSREWRATFKISYDQNGSLVGVFANPELITSAALTGLMYDVAVQGNFFDYGGRVGNVQSYSWKNNQGDRGVGAGANLMMVNGQIRIQRYRVETEEVQTWKLNREKLRRYLERKRNQGIADLNKAFLEFLSTKRFEDVEEFFDPVESETAPQGAGYTFDITAMGDPLITTSNLAQFGEGFPDLAGRGGRRFKWYVRKVVHNVNQRGYTIDVEIVDEFAISPAGQGLL